MFIGEQAVDEGGPRREFFRLVLRGVFSSSGLFTGCPDHVVPVHNVEALENNKFFIVGRMIATSLVQGGESPSCLETSEVLFAWKVFLIILYAELSKR